jgi:hypothetical protein
MFGSVAASAAADSAAAESTARSAAILADHHARERQQRASR